MACVIYEMPRSLSGVCVIYTTLFCDIFCDYVKYPSTAAQFVGLLHISLALWHIVWLSDMPHGCERYHVYMAYHVAMWQDTHAGGPAVPHVLWRKVTLDAPQPVKDFSTASTGSKDGIILFSLKSVALSSCLLLKSSKSMLIPYHVELMLKSILTSFSLLFFFWPKKFRFRPWESREPNKDNYTHVRISERASGYHASIEMF